ncbi:MAG: SoxR reducing system RseC family protein [Halothiobacillaceae bacterium]|nr:SoxR reducing system RseC family protein [Halothiobacillaceae bacterium]MDD3609928.1 SoxR reducing system RseC family protein [Halothiobacillaceae bacterium]
MIEEQADVVRVEPGLAWVQPRRASGCQSCSAGATCGSGLMAQALGAGDSLVRVLDPLGVRPGDTVVLGLAEQALVRGAAVVYLLPVVGLLLGSVAGAGLLGDSLAVADMLGALVGFVGGLLLVRAFGRRVRTSEVYHPVVLRRVIPLQPLPVGGSCERH